MNIQVNSLHFKGQCDAPHHQAFLIEDALNTQLSAETRLVLVRHLNLIPTARLSRTASDSRVLIASRVAQSWSRVMDQACHGSSDSASSANVVWFADEAEAKQVLLARLLKKQNVGAWFWKLAVKRWDGAPLAKWLAEELHAETTGALGQNGLFLLVTLLKANEIIAVKSALAEYLKIGEASALWSPETSFKPTFQVPVAEHEGENWAPGKPLERALEQRELHRLAHHVKLALPNGLPDIILQLATRLSSPTPLVALVERFISQSVPELCLQPDLLHKIADLITHGRDIVSDVKNESKRHTQTEPVASKSKKEIINNNIPPNIKTDAKKIHPATAETQPPQEHITAANQPPSDRPEPAPTPLGMRPHEHHSAAAGLFYLYTPLRQLGWPDWLRARPKLLASNPTVQLLDHIARHHRCDPMDPVFAFLQERNPDPDQQLDPEIMRPWRVALDRWLVRNAQTKLADLVAKPGWIMWRQDQLCVRFKMQQIDLRLRRLAIDRDPGWMDWAGMSVRFHFSDRPLFQDIWHDD